MANSKRPSIIARIIPYVILGIAIVFMFIAFIFVSSVLLIGAVVGLIIFAISYLKARFFNSKKQDLVTPSRQTPPPQKPQGKVYEHEESKDNSNSN